MKNVRRPLFVAFFFFVVLTGDPGFRSTIQAQSKFKSLVYGTVVDAATGECLSNVNVFLSNTTLGAATAPDGSYKIVNIPPGAYTVVFSRIGYEILTIQLQFGIAQAFEYDVQLIQKPIQGREVSVTASIPKGWKQDLKKFTKLFIGESKNSKKTRILNPYVLDFTTDKDTKVFSATSDSILKIENQALGYRMDALLVRFDFNDRTGQCVYGMYARYEEMDSNNENEIASWKKNRLSTYQGSFRHFLAALARQELEREDFQIYEILGLGLALVDDKNMILPGAEHQSYENQQIMHSESDMLDVEFATRHFEFIYGKPIPINENTIIFSDSGSAIKKLKFDNYLGVTYKKLNFNKLCNFLKLRHTFAEIDTFGNNLSPYAIAKYGDWSTERIADSLPLNYRPEDENDEK